MSGVNSESRSSSVSTEEERTTTSWAVCFCVVTFDLELGQSMETIYPYNVQLKEVEKTNICYMAFPDTNSSSIGDMTFHFRLRCGDSKYKHYAVANEDDNDLPYALSQFNNICAPPLKYSTNYLHAYAHFHQVKDSSNRRGYFQKSVLLLSHFPFTNFFLHLISRAGPEFFQHGMAVLESVWQQMCHWPEPNVNINLQLPLLSSLVQIHLQCNRFSGSADEKELADALKLEQFKDWPYHYSLPNIYHLEMYRILAPLLQHMHILWELVLLNKPIIIHGHTPRQVSQVVQALVSLIWPLEYCTDYRPYFTIHDSEFKDYTTAPVPPRVILGVTNPFFSKTTENWPNILHMPTPLCLLNNGSTPEPSADSPEHRLSVSGTTTASGNDSPALAKKKSFPKVKSFHSLLSSEEKAVLETNHQAYLKKDKDLVKLLAPDSCSPAILMMRLRAYLAHRTSTLLSPLSSHLSYALSPTENSYAAFSALPRIKQFDPDAFLSSAKNKKGVSGSVPAGGVTSSGVLGTLPRPFNNPGSSSAANALPTSTPQGDWTGLYREFFTTPNCLQWFKTHERLVNYACLGKYLEKVAACNVREWTDSHHEVEIIDLYLSLFDYVKKFVTSGHLPSSQTASQRTKLIECLYNQLAILLSALPEDVQNLLLAKTDPSYLATEFNEPISQQPSSNHTNNNGEGMERRQSIHEDEAKNSDSEPDEAPMTSQINGSIES